MKLPIEKNTITEITDTNVYMYDWEDGIYKLPSGCAVWYSYLVSTAENAKSGIAAAVASEDAEYDFTLENPSYVFLMSSPDSTYKTFCILTIKNGVNYLYSGCLTPQSNTYIGGSYQMQNLQAYYLTSISTYVKNDLTYSTSNTTFALSAYQGYLLNNRLKVIEKQLGIE